MSVSTVPATKIALANAITTQVNDPSVLVAYDAPGPNQPDDIIVVGNVSRSVEPYQMVGSGGTGWLDETFDVEVVVSVYRGGDAAQTTFERATTLAAAVETAVRNDITISGNVIVAWPSRGDYQSEWEAEHKGRLVTVTLAIRCRARI